jgi:methyl-accepting chemotaxis protein
MADLKYRQLQKAVTDLGREVTRGAEAIHARAQKIDEEAQDTARLAEQIHGMGVDPDTISETRETAKLMASLSAGARTYASAGDTTARAAKAAHDQAHASHDGINEKINRSPVDVSNLNREWLRQE